MIDNQPILKWLPMCVKMAPDQPLFWIAKISMILISWHLAKSLGLWFHEILQTSLWSWFHNIWQDHCDPDLMKFSKNLCDLEIHHDEDVMMALIMIKITFDKSHLTKEEKEMSPPWSATTLRNLWRIWPLGWKSFTFTENIKKVTKLWTFPCF